MKDTTEEISHETGPVTPAHYGSPNYVPTDPPKVPKIDSYRVAPPKASAEALYEAIARLGMASALIAYSRCWVRQHLATGEGDFECSPFGTKAKAWSMTGAMLRAVPIKDGDLAATIAWAALSTSIRDRHNAVSIGYFNDFVATSVEDVLAEFTAAADLIDAIRKDRGL